KHTGQTASIYLTDRIAEEKGRTQIGSLVHTVALKQGPVFLTAVPDNKQASIAPNLNWLPYGSVVMADQGFPYLRRYRNLQYREVNHSVRAKDTKRNKWGRNRWSRNGINNQVAEGIQRTLKYSVLSAHGYIKPENMPLYLDEFSAIKGVRHFGIDNIANCINNSMSLGNMSLK
ncbi:MAG: transposase, partial [Leptospiraceae bacterium]|nr:transposase [Leptospiraceae bacterium]